MALGAFLGQRQEKILHPIYYDRKVFNIAQKNYTVIEHELVVVMFALEKFQSYLLGVKVIVHNNHAPLRYLMAKNYVMTRLIH